MGIFGSSRSFIGSSSFFFVFGTDVVFLTRSATFPSATNNVRPTREGAAAAARRRHGLEFEDEGLLKDLVVIFIFFEVLYIVRCFF
jgi:hypothetical protein